MKEHSSLWNNLHKFIPTSPMCGVFLEGYIHIRPLKNISLFLPVEFEAVILIQNVLYSP